MNIFKRKVALTKAPAAARVETLIGPKTTITGDIRFESAIRIDGDVRGNVVPSDPVKREVTGPLSHVTIGKDGTVSGDIEADNVSIEGALYGEVLGTWVHLTATAKVYGDVSYYQTLQVDPGAQVEGKMIRMNSLSAMSPLSEDEHQGHIMSPEEIQDANLPPLPLSGSVYVSTPIPAV